MLRLPRWLRRRTSPPGRHVSRVPMSSGAGAAMTLMNGAVAAADRATALVPEGTVTTAVLDVPLDIAPTPATEHDVPVSLEFADGARMELEASDPRVEAFLSAAAAVVGGSPGGSRT